MNNLLAQILARLRQRQQYGMNQQSGQEYMGGGGMNEGPYPQPNRGGGFMPRIGQLGGQLPGTVSRSNDPRIWNGFGGTPYPGDAVTEYRTPNVQFPYQQPGTRMPDATQIGNPYDAKMPGTSGGFGLPYDAQRTNPTQITDPYSAVLEGGNGFGGTSNMNFSANPVKYPMQQPQSPWSTTRPSSLQGLMQGYRGNQPRSGLSYL